MERILLEFEFDADTGTLRQVEGGLDRVDRAAKKSAGGVGLLSRGLHALKANVVLAGLAALYGAFRAIGESVSTAGVQDIANKKLAQALVNTGEGGGKAAAGLAKLAAETQNVSNYGDESIMTAQAMLLSFGEVGGSRGAGLLTQSLVDMAAGLEKAGGGAQDLNQIAAALGKSLTTGSGALKRYGISLTESQQAAFDTAEGLEKVALLAEIVESNFGGLAAATVDPMKQMKNATGDLAEEFGGPLRTALAEASIRLTALAQDPGVIALFQKMGGAMGWLVSATLATIQAAIRFRYRFPIPFREAVNDTVGAIRDAQRWFAGLLADLAGVSAALPGFGAGLSATFAAMAGRISGAANASERYRKSHEAVTESWRTRLRALDAQAAAQEGAIEAARTMAAANASLGASASAAAAAIAGDGGGEGKSLKDAAKDFVGVLKEAQTEGEKLERQLRDLERLTPAQARQLATIRRELARQRREIAAAEAEINRRAGLGPNDRVEGRGMARQGGDEADTARTTALQGAQELRDVLLDTEALALDTSSNVLGALSGMVNNYGALLSDALGGVGALFASVGQQSEAAFRVYQGIAIAQAIVDTYKAANVALSSAPPPFNYIAMAGVIAAGLANVNAIRQQQPGGSAARSSGGARSAPSRPAAPSGAAGASALGGGSVESGLALGFGRRGSGVAPGTASGSAAAPAAPVVVIRGKSLEHLVDSIETVQNRRARNLGPSRSRS